MSSRVRESKVTTERVLVTPELAAKWLLNNDHNRPIREARVNSYARDMIADNWMDNGETIKFDTTGRVLDGQHRLAAIVAAQVAVELTIVRGLPREAGDTIDTGARRLFSDVLSRRIPPEKNPLHLAALVRAVHAWELGYRRDLGSRFFPSNLILLEVLNKHPELREIVKQTSNERKNSPLTPAVYGLCLWLFSQIDSDEADDFFQKLNTQANLDVTSPIYQLNRTLSGMRERREKMRTSHLVGLTIKAWNLWRDGEDSSLLRFTMGGARPEAYPEPH